MAPKKRQLHLMTSRFIFFYYRHYIIDHTAPKRYSSFGKMCINHHALVFSFFNHHLWFIGNKSGGVKFIEGGSPRTPRVASCLACRTRTLMAGTEKRNPGTKNWFKFRPGGMRARKISRLFIIRAPGQEKKRIDKKFTTSLNCLEKNPRMIYYLRQW